MSTDSRPRNDHAQPVIPDAERFLNDEYKSIPTTAGGTALSSVPGGTRHAYIFARTNDVIFRPNGTDSAGTTTGGNPDATHGVTIVAGEGYDYTGDPSQLKFLGVVGPCDLYVMYFGEVN